MLIEALDLAPRSNHFAWHAMPALSAVFQDGNVSGGFCCKMCSVMFRCAWTTAECISLSTPVIVSLSTPLAFSARTALTKPGYCIQFISVVRLTVRLVYAPPLPCP